MKAFLIDSRFPIKYFEERGFFIEAFGARLLFNSSLTVISQRVKGPWEENGKEKKAVLPHFCWKLQLKVSDFVCSRMWY